MNEMTPLQAAMQDIDFEYRYNRLLEAVEKVLVLDDQLLEIVDKVTSEDIEPAEEMLLNFKGVRLTEQLTEHIQAVRELVRG